MKLFRHPKLDPPPDELVNITHQLRYNDPAFSPDPLANPFFSSNLPPAWSLPPGPGHPTLKKTPRPTYGEEYQPPQPPNSPVVPEPEPAVADNEEQSHLSESTASSHLTTDIPASTDSASSSSSSPSVPAVQLPSSSSSSLSSSDPSLSPPEPHVHSIEVERVMPHHAHHHPSPQHTHYAPPSKPDPKKRQGILSRLLGSTSPTESPQITTSSSLFSSSNNSKRNNPMLHMPPPSSRSAPEVHRPERPVMPQRANTVETSVGPARPPIVPAVAAAVSRAADDRRLRQDLDRIDELDETNPFGLAVHHGGPYEAISRIVRQEPSTAQNEHGRGARIQTGGRNFVMPKDTYRNVQLRALQNSFHLRPGEILPRDFPLHPEPPHPYPRPHPYPPLFQLQPQPRRHPAHPRTQLQQGIHQDHDTRHAYYQPHAPIPEPGSLLEHPTHTQKVPLVLQAGSSGFSSASMSSSSLSSSPLTRHQTPSSTAANRQFDDEDGARLAIGMALIGTGVQNTSSTSSDTPTVVGTEVDPASPVQINIVLREPTEINESNPPPYMPDPPPSTSRMQVPIANENRTQEPLMAERIRSGRRESPPSKMPQQLSNQESPQFVPASAPILPHASWHWQQAQPSTSQPYQRPSRQNIHSLQLPPQQCPVVPANPGLSRSSTYAGSFAGPSTDRLLLASSLKSTGNAPSSSSASSLRDRESDVRSVQQSILTTSNASSRSQGENPRRNRYLPKRLVMPAPLQPLMENQTTARQIPFGPQANSNYSGGPSLKPRRSSTLVPAQAREVPMESNGKLRKRVSLIGNMSASKEPSTSPVAAVSFSTNIVSVDWAGTRLKPQRGVLRKKR